MENLEQKKLHPCISMLFKPRQTIQQIITVAPNHCHFILLAILMGLPLGIAKIVNSVVYGEINTSYFIAASILKFVFIYSVFTVTMLYLSAYIIYVFGKLLKGQATYQNVIAAKDWSYIPLIWFSLFYYIQIALLGDDFSQNPNRILEQLLFYKIIASIASVWFIIILVFTLSKVQKFSIWKAFGNLICFFITMSCLMFLFITIIEP